jgi:hypothetical protein
MDHLVALTPALVPEIRVTPMLAATAATAHPVLAAPVALTTPLHPIHLAPAALITLPHPTHLAPATLTSPLHPTHLTPAAPTNHPVLLRALQIVLIVLATSLLPLIRPHPTSLVNLALVPARARAPGPRGASHPASPKRAGLDSRRPPLSAGLRRGAPGVRVHQLLL